MSTFEFQQDGETRRTSGSFFRGENTNFHPTQRSFDTSDFVSKYLMKGWAPVGRPVTRETPIVAFGSCFASNISNYLHERGYNVLTKKEGQAYVTQMGDGIVHTTAILQQFEWAWRCKVPAGDLWHGYKAKEFGYDEDVRRATNELFDAAEVFIITLGLSEVWYDEPTGGVFWRAVPKDRYDASRHKFRVATHAETLRDLKEIYSIIREYRPKADIVFTVSPIPLTATFRPVSCISADAVSKAIIRSALDEFLREINGDPCVHYMPSYEAVTRLFHNQWTEDRRHVQGPVLDFNMKIFEHYFCNPGIPKEAMQDSFKLALENDARLGMNGMENDGLSYVQLREVRIAERREAKLAEKRDAKRAARLAQRSQDRVSARIAARKAMRIRPMKNDRPKINYKRLLVKSAVGALAALGAWSLVVDYAMAL